ncbi:MAG: histidinol-phosphatase HisJ family protein [Lachnospiraceae bacterium]|nr:histidinol-phosphatase HisJ family protein [Lachnospiraceae bacterium]
MIIADTHNHSYFSTDSEAPLKQMLQGAVDKGLSIYCVTEHMDYKHHIYDQRFDPEFEMKGCSKKEIENSFNCDTDAFMKELFELRDEFKDVLDVRFGMELGLQPELADHYADYVKKYPFDFLIGSCHEADGLDPYYSLFYKGRTDIEGARDYFAKTLECAVKCVECYDSLGHVDYGIRYQMQDDYVFRYEDYADIFDELLKFLIKKDKALEFNSKCFKYFKKEDLPMEQIFKRYKELGGELITIGSDAHRVSDIAGHYDETFELLRRLGFKTYTVYKARRPEVLPLSDIL